VESSLKAMSESTRAIVVSHVEFGCGFRNDIPALSELCHDRGALLFVDAAQSLGVMDVDVRRMGIDALSSCGYKWLCGPSGTGLLYVRRDLIPELRPLLDRDDRKVRMEVLETLVRFHDPESVDLLRKFLKQKNAEDQLRVIEIVGMYKVADLAEDLASMVKTFSLFRLDYTRDEKIIEALGRIGHPSAIPVLERLAKTRFSLYPKQLAHLKLLLFQSLRFYEADPLSSLLRIGSQSKDTRIRTACRESLPGRGDMQAGRSSATGEA